jgi:hypothetical protein
MTRRVLVLLAIVVLLATGCTVGSEDANEPRPTPTPATATPLPAPRTLPVGTADVATDDVVWAQGSVLHVGLKSVDVSPLNIDSLVVVPGGVFFLDRRELWMTDLTRVRPTRVTGVTQLATTLDGGVLRVVSDDGTGGTTTHAWNTRTGAAVPPGSVHTATAADLQGRPARVLLQPHRGDSNPVASLVGTGGYGVAGDETHRLVAYDTSSSEEMPLTLVPGDGFELVRWTSGTSFYGLALSGGRPLATVGCSIESGTCTTWGKVAQGRSLVFESGT